MKDTISDQEDMNFEISQSGEQRKKNRKEQRKPMFSAGFKY